MARCVFLALPKAAPYSAPLKYFWASGQHFPICSSARVGLSKEEYVK